MHEHEAFLGVNIGMPRSSMSIDLKRDLKNTHHSQSFLAVGPVAQVPRGFGLHRVVI